MILDLAVEDSYALSELVAQVSGVRTNMSVGEIRRLVRACTVEMLRSGLLDVTRLEVPGGPEPVLDQVAAEVALSDDLEWIEAPHWRSHARVVATAQGRILYYGSGERRAREDDAGG